MKYEINMERLQQHKHKLCPCLVPNNEHKKVKYQCPCDKFCNEGICVCRIFVKVE